MNLFYKTPLLNGLFIISFLFFTNFTGYAQKIKLPIYTVETGASIAVGKQTPFWLMSNQYGLLTPNTFNSWIKTGFHTSLDSSKKIDYDYGFDLVNRYSNNYDLYIHQGYGRLKLWFIHIQAGKMEEKFGNQDPELSSGGLLWSGNARPMPKITINVPQYTRIPFTKGYAEFKGGISHGWFGSNEYNKNVWLHHKYLYLQIGGKLPIHIHYGFHHFAQWGGVSNDSTIGRLPSGFSDFIKVFMVKSGGGSTSTPWVESYNRIGNHLGSENLGLDISLKKIKISAYWQTIFEDGSGFHRRNSKDGLWGISAHLNNQKSIVTGFLFEYLNTTDQSGPINDTGKTNPDGTPEELGGNDNYFNNYIYRKGWTYYGKTLGTPFLTSIDMKKDIIAANEQIFNNKTRAYHIALKGNVNKLLYTMHYVWYNNWGTNFNPISPSKQQSIALELKFANTIIYSLQPKIKLGIDLGGFYGNNAGVQLAISKSF